MNCLDDKMISKLAELFFSNKSVSDDANNDEENKECKALDFPIKEVSEIHTYNLGYELHVIVKMDLYMDSNPTEYVMLFIDNVCSLDPDIIDQFAFIHVESYTCHIPDDRKHFVYDWYKNTVIPYNQFEHYLKSSKRFLR